MAEQKKNRAPKVAEAFSTLSTLVEQAEAQKDQPRPVADFASKVGALTSYASKLDDASKLAVVESLGNNFDDAAETFTRLASLVELLKGSAEVLDRDEGDRRAKALRSAIDAEVLEDSDIEEATNLVTRWAASAPKGSKSGTQGSRAEGSKPLGFTVRTTCQKVGCGWTSTTERDDLNSARHAAREHAKKAHSATIDSGTESHKGITEALAKVGFTPTRGFDRGEAQATEGGGFTFSRAS